MRGHHVLRRQLPVDLIGDAVTRHAPLEGGQTADGVREPRLGVGDRCDGHAVTSLIRTERGFSPMLIDTSEASICSVVMPPLRASDR